MPAFQPTVAGGAPSRDIWSDIGGAIGGLFGLPQQHAADQAQKQSAEQQALANQYGQQGAGVFGQLGQQGQGQYNAYNQNYLGLLNQYGQTAGLGNTIQGQQGQGQNPYQLDQNQQALFNQSNAQIANASKQAQAQFQQHMAAQGISDPRALQVGQEQLQEHFNALQQETEAKFYEQIKQDKEQALQQIISQLGQYGQQGIGQQEAAGSGFLGLASGAQSFAAQNQNVALQQQSNGFSQEAGLAQFIAKLSGVGVRQPGDTIQYNPG